MRSMLARSDGIIVTDIDLTPDEQGVFAAAAHRYLYGEDARVLTQNELEAKLANREPEVNGLRSVVMIQCVGSREPDRPWCSRICCSHASCRIACAGCSPSAQGPA